jgi:CDP-diglyceride synthetase
MPRLFFGFLRFDNEPARPLSTQEHSRWKIVAWLYTALWLGVGLSVKFVLPVSLVIKAPVYLVLLVAAPALTDLFESYASYLKRRTRSDVNSKSVD